ncbi:IS5 family transposase [Luteimicrobium album]|uniref:IS5 family transposase n=1 Tax=Luteimicrobium album TaxID=1054550 RepID=A0ABQ6I310_9MICO|nr:IS5 family transposase [Luteimicrobium album]
MIPVHAHGGRPCCKHRWREYVNALLYVVTTGCPWRALPHDFAVTWSATHKHFTWWTRKQVWEQALAVLRAEDRVHDGRGEHPTAANVQDRAAFADLLAKNPCASLSHVWADKGYTGQAPADAAAKAGIKLELVSVPKPESRFVVQPRRWVVERTNGWSNRHRRLVRQYEASLAAHEAFVTLQIRILLRRLDRR